MASYGQKIADELKEKFKISAFSANTVKRQVDNIVQKALIEDAKYYFTEPEKRSIQTYTKDEVIEIATLREQIKEIAKDDFPGRIYTRAALDKMDRLSHLENKYKEKESKAKLFETKFTRRSKK
jgi:hypothetical protein